MGTGDYMLPSNLNLNIRKTVGYNNKTLISNTDIEIGSNNDVKKYHKKLSAIPLEPGEAESAALKMDKPIKDYLAVQYEQTDNPKMLAD